MIIPFFGGNALHGKTYSLVALYFLSRLGERHIHYSDPSHGVINARSISRKYSADRLTFTSGNFFKHDLPKADVVLMGHILHDWDLPTKKMLIQKAFGLMMSLNMLIETPGGFDYTGADCKVWMKDVGFSAMRVEQLTGPDSMVIGIK